MCKQILQACAAIGREFQELDVASICGKYISSLYLLALSSPFVAKQQNFIKSWLGQTRTTTVVLHHPSILNIAFLFQQRKIFYLAFSTYQRIH